MMSGESPYKSTFHHASSVEPRIIAASMVSASSLAIALLSPAVLTIVLTPPVNPRLALIMAVKIAGNRIKAEIAATRSKSMITVMNGLIASIGIK